MNTNNLISIVQRAQAPTPPFFKKLRTIGLVLAATGGAIIAKADDLPAVATTIAGYLTLAGSITGAISQLTIATPDDNYIGNRPAPALLESVYAMLPEAARQQQEGKEMADKIYAFKHTSIGSIAPDFTQADTSGKPVSLKDFRGKYVLLDFWASWCGPCRAENPNVVKAYNTYKDKNFTVLSVSLDGDKGGQKAWMDAIHKDGLAWTHVSDLKGWANAVAKVYDIHGVPSSFLLDPNGKIIARDLRGKELTNKLEALLAR